METVRTDLTVADFTAAFERGDILINREYQRSDKVWPDSAKSFLIETLILGYPLPKLSMYQETDIKSQRTIKEIVDGQQRSVTIYDYLRNKFRLSSKLQTDRLRNRRYADLDDSDKERLLSYSLPIDLFVAATPFDIRETFRRMNSYTIPLNAEEQRHARFQGAFKWFVYQVARDYEELFMATGTFNAKKLVRMQDTKLVSEIVHAFEYGIQTTSRTSLNGLYEEYDEAFPSEQRLTNRFATLHGDIHDAVDIIAGTETAKQHMMYALMLALMHGRRAITSLKPLYTFKSPLKKMPSSFGAAVEWLDDLLGESQVPRKYQALYGACTTKTNVKSERAIRFKWYCKVLDGVKLS